MRIGVYVCHCGGNISEVVNIDEVLNSLKNEHDVAFVKDHEHLCSKEGQEIIFNDIQEYKLDKITIAACSPQFQGPTFKTLMERAGLSPYLMEMANIREQSAWVHYDDHKKATDKAKELTKMAIAKVRYNEPLSKYSIDIGKRTLIIGAGIAGIQAALDLADSGIKVYLVEKDPSIGGHMAQLSRTFPTEDCSACILSPKMADVPENPNIELLTYGEIKDVSGYLGNFHITVNRKPTYVDAEKCTACGDCADVCPVELLNEYDGNLATRKAIYLPTKIAVPHSYVLDTEHCLGLNPLACGKCQEVCKADAINYDLYEEEIEFDVDTIIVATGFELFDAKEKPEYGFGKFKNVIDGMQMERIIVSSAEGNPLKDIGKKIAYIQCIGSRDKQIGRPYCSRICCMYAIKQANLLKKGMPDRDIYIFYIDIRAFGKGFEEYYNTAQENGVKFIRGKVAELMENPDTGKIIVKAEDTLNRQMIETEFDTVVLSVGIGPSKTTENISNMLKLARSSDGFLQEAHPKFKPVDTLVPGIFLAGTIQGPKDIPDTVSQASGSAARAIRLMNQGEYFFDPLLAFVDEEKCDGCGLCVDHCPYNAISMAGKTAEVNTAFCSGCGSCISYCPKDALDLHLYTNKQLLEQIKEAVINKGDEPRVLVFADDMTAYRLADNVGNAKGIYSPYSRIIKVPSSCRVTPKLLLQAFHYGADSVLILGTETKSSPYPHCQEEIERSVKIVHNILKENEISDKRLFNTTIVTVMIKKFSGIINTYTDLAKTLGPIPLEKREKLLKDLGKKIFGGSHE